jgi:retron-type reverse transcriptase
LPQGSPLSPLLANLLLDEPDKELEKRGHRFCRYADDFSIYAKQHLRKELNTFIREWVSYFQLARARSALQSL